MTSQSLPSSGKQRALSIDIVIPVLNEERGIAAALESLERSLDAARRSLPNLLLQSEVYVIDGGSTDRTVELAESRGARVLAAGRAGRGSQLAAGVRSGCGELVLMLHADAVLNEDAVFRLLFTLDSDPDIQWGIMGHAYDNKQLKLRVIEVSNRLRFSFAGIAFGDQGIFVRRTVLEQVGGVPELRLMEDVELSLRLRRGRRRRSLGQTLVVSSRRWQKKGFSGYTLQVLLFVSHYLLHRLVNKDVESISDRMYDRYYRRRPKL